MFIGKVFHQIDEKGRIRIPAKFKDGLGVTPFVIMQAPGNVLRIYPGKVAEEIFKNISEGIDFLDTSRSNAQAFLMSNSEYVEADTQGRTLLSQDQIDFAGLKKDIVISGAYDHLVICDKDRWEEEKRATDMSTVYSVINSGRSKDKEGSKEKEE